MTVSGFSASLIGLALIAFAFAAERAAAGAAAAGSPRCSPASRCAPTRTFMASAAAFRKVSAVSLGALFGKLMEDSGSVQRSRTMTGSARGGTAVSSPAHSSPMAASVCCRLQVSADGAGTFRAAGIPRRPDAGGHRAPAPDLHHRHYQARRRSRTRSRCHFSGPPFAAPGLGILVADHVRLRPVVAQSPGGDVRNGAGDGAPMCPTVSPPTKVARTRHPPRASSIRRRSGHSKTTECPAGGGAPSSR